MRSPPLRRHDRRRFAGEQDPDPAWDTAQSDYEVTHRRRHGHALITADQIDDSDGGAGTDIEWMFRRTRPRRRPRALEDESEDDEEDDGNITKRREMTMAALAGISPSSASDGHRRSQSYGRSRGHASSSSVGHGFTPTKPRASPRPSTADDSSPNASVPSFIDPFTRSQLPPVPPVPPGAGAAAPPPLERSKSSPVLPQRSARRPLPPPPQPQQTLPAQLTHASPSSNEPPPQQQSRGMISRFFRAGSGSVPGGAKVLRKNDRERERERERSLERRREAGGGGGSGFRYVPAHPVPVPPMPKEFVRGHRSSVSFSESIDVENSSATNSKHDVDIRVGGSNTQIDIVDADGRKNFAPVDDVMFALRQLRSM